MNVSLILGHPRPDSFNHAIAETARATLRAHRHAVAFHDLYGERFDPLMGAAESLTRLSDDPLVERHCAEIARAEGIIVVHPNWWGGPPAIVKGWIDRVIRPGVAYDMVPGDGGEPAPVGRLRTATALVITTANTPPERERDLFGDMLEVLWRRCIWGLSGVPRIERIAFSVVAASTPEMRTTWLEQVRAAVARHFPIG